MPEMPSSDSDSVREFSELETALHYGTLEDLETCLSTITEFDFNALVVAFEGDEQKLQLVLENKVMWPISADDLFKLLEYCLDDSWKLMHRDDVKTILIENWERFVKSSETDKHSRHLVHQWEVFDPIEQDNVPKDLKIPARELYRRLKFAEEHLSDCIGWIGEKKDFCYHVYNFVEQNGSICSGKANAQHIRRKYKKRLSDDTMALLMEHSDKTDQKTNPKLLAYDNHV